MNDETLFVRIQNETKWNLIKCKNYFRSLNDYQFQYYLKNNTDDSKVTYYMDYVVNKYKYYTNIQQYILTVVATVFFPLSFITGYFGMNFKSMNKNVFSFRHGQLFVGFLCLLTIITTICILLIGLYMF